MLWCARTHVDLPAPCSRAARCTGPLSCEISHPACNLLHCCGFTTTWNTAESLAGPSAALTFIRLSKSEVLSVSQRDVTLLQIKHEARSRWRTPPSPQKRLSGVVSHGNKQQTRLTSPPLPAQNQSFGKPKQKWHQKRNQALFSHTRQALTIGVNATHSPKQIHFTKAAITFHVVNQVARWDCFAMLCLLCYSHKNIN